MMVDAKFEIFEDNRGYWRFRLVSGNGKIMLQSEGYASIRNAKRAINTIENAMLGYYDVEVLE